MTIKERVTAVYAALGLPATILLVVVVAALIWFAVGGLTNAVDSAIYQREIDQLRQQADAERQKAAAAEAEANQYKGAAAVYRQQADEIQNILTELQNERPELQKRTEAARQRVEEIRNRPAKPVGDNVRQRVDELGAKLDQLYPEPGQR